MRLNTFSITAYDGRTGMCGVAVSTKVPAVGGLCVFTRAGVGAVATQAWTNPLLGVDGLDMLADAGAQVVLDRLLEDDPEREARQVAVVDTAGGAAAHTGADTDQWCGHRVGDGYVVAGNMLVGVETVEAMATEYERVAGAPLAERLLAALEAGQAAGGDKRGRQSAALQVAHTEPYPYLDLRVDEHTDPVRELRRVYQVAEVELLPFSTALPTRANPAGAFSADLRAAMRPQDTGGS